MFSIICQWREKNLQTVTDHCFRKKKNNLLKKPRKKSMKHSDKDIQAADNYIDNPEVWNENFQRNNSFRYCRAFFLKWNIFFAMMRTHSGVARSALAALIGTGEPLLLACGCTSARQVTNGRCYSCNCQQLFSAWYIARSHADINNSHYRIPFLRPSTFFSLPPSSHRPYLCNIALRATLHKYCNRSKLN